jgi:hypothetical protein
MKYLKIKVLIITLAGVMVCSCDRDELFEREQYKKVFALLSDDEFNIFAEEHDLALDESQGFVSAVCGGGSLPTEKDINITIVEDEDLLLQYNMSNYDVNVSEYAHLLSKDKYSIANYSITIPAGERNGLMSIKIRANGLSPDSAYFIPLRVDRFTAYEVNPDKSNVLYRVFMKNYYAVNKSETIYTCRGKRNGINVVGNKRVFPVRGNSVRIMAGELTFEPTVNVINEGSILLTVDENNNVRIDPWKNIEVTQVNDDPEYPNIFYTHDDGYNTYKIFLLRYDYVYGGTTYSMQEELRIEFKEEDEY